MYRSPFGAFTFIPPSLQQSEHNKLKPNVCRPKYTYSLLGRLETMLVRIRGPNSVYLGRCGSSEFFFLQRDAYFHIRRRTYVGKVEHNISYQSFRVELACQSRYCAKVRARKRLLGGLGWNVLQECYITLTNCNLFPFIWILLIYYNLQNWNFPLHCNTFQ